MSLSNLTRIFELATDHELALGWDYYQTTHDKLQYIAQVMGMHPDAVCGAFAALSPNLDETGNYVSLIQMVHAHHTSVPVRVQGYPLNRDKAARILTGGDPMRVLSGNKVVAFYRCIADPTANNVVVDGHLYNAWRNEVRNLRRDSGFPASHYGKVSRDVIDLAASYSWHPPAVQATLWITWKRLHGILPLSQQQVLPGLEPATGRVSVLLYRLGYVMADGSGRSG